MVHSASLFSQLVGFFSRRRFYSLVGEHRAERYLIRCPWATIAEATRCRLLET